MKKINIALLGFGNVGKGVWKILNTNKKDICERYGYEIEVKKVLVKDLNKIREIKLQHGILTDNFCDILNDNSIDLVVEVMGGEFPALEYMIEAMKKNKHIVTANKLCIAKHRELLLKTSLEKKVFLYYEASVGGGIPIIKQIDESLTSNKIEKITGILNGTTNYILTKMDEENMTFETALNLAKEKGFAEADSSSDIGGYDSLYKLAIMSSLCFKTSVNPDDISREGIENIEKEDIEYAKSLGFTIKLLAVATLSDNNIKARVRPCFISREKSFATVRDSFNAISIKGDAVGEVISYGQGAGSLPTGSAVVSDILSIIRNDLSYKNINHYREIKNKFSVINNDIESEFYIRINPKSSNEITKELNKEFLSNNIKLSLVTKDENNLIIITKKCSENLLKDLIKRVKNNLGVNFNVNIIKIENFE